MNTNIFAGCSRALAARSHFYSSSFRRSNPLSSPALCSRGEWRPQFDPHGWQLCDSTFSTSGSPVNLYRVLGHHKLISFSCLHCILV
ncbi:hypothetical protein GOP47_0022961 [Adiantum capillus-veneris]|uniref:Uncharacterized protein n=1 Tax=Adiantum capillus-veneris TaxID=13818 RepID=A0A9D4Z6H5_ADICA|nr:hypothetical protein GOP47_0022961 [Adiantum capillus-veneris]